VDQQQIRQIRHWAGAMNMALLCPLPPEARKSPFAANERQQLFHFRPVIAAGERET
jgi:hypothetical protein